MKLGIDIGGTKTAAIAMDSAGRLSEQVLMPTGFGPKAVLEAAVEIVHRVAERAGRRLADIASIGIGIPGAVDSANGRVSHAVNLGTGLAAGIVLGGSLLRGGHGVAGEIGHIPIDPNGVRCGCGQVGCLETLASGSAIARMWPTEGTFPAKALFDAAASGDPAALAVQRTFFDAVASAVRILVLTADVDVIVIGGGLSALGAPLVAGVNSALRSTAVTSRFLASQALEKRVHVIPLGFPAAAVGAALTGRAI